MASAQTVDRDLRVQRDPHLAPPGKHVDRAVVVVVQESSVRRRRLGELVHFVAQRGDVLAGFAQGIGELLVLGDGLGKLPLGLQQPLFQSANTLGGILQPLAEYSQLFLQRGHLLGRRRLLLWPLLVRRVALCHTNPTLHALFQFPLYGQG